MKLKLLIALVAVPTLVMAQAGLPSANVGSSVQTGATPTQQTAPNPNSTTGSSAGNKQTNVGGINMDFDSSGKSTSTTPTNVGGKVDGHGSSNKATVKGSSQGSTFTNPCSSARTCN